MNLGPPLPSFAYGSTALPAHVNARHSLSIKRVKSAEVRISVYIMEETEKEDLNDCNMLEVYDDIIQCDKLEQWWFHLCRTTETTC